MNYLFLTLGILLVSASVVVIYLTIENNKDDPDTLQIVLYSISALMGLIVSVLCFCASVNCGKKRKGKKGYKFR
jgi:uncharacterized membrane protein HdeD (DUF308 family)